MCAGGLRAHKRNPGFAPLGTLPGMEPVNPAEVYWVSGWRFPATPGLTDADGTPGSEHNGSPSHPVLGVLRRNLLQAPRTQKATASSP